MWRTSFVLALALPSCANLTYEDMRTQNALGLREIGPGMTKEQVLEIMGTETKRVCRGVAAPCFRTKTVPVLNPYRVEASAAGGDVLVEVLYYYTDVKKRDDEISDDELTPLVFVNGKLLGWGWTFLRGVTERYEVQHLYRP